MVLTEMHNGTLEKGASTSHFDDDQSKKTDQPPQSNRSEAENTASLNEQAVLENEENQAGDNSNDAHPNKKRKLTDPPKGKALTTLRPISPPWKKIAVEGPTSFVAEGRRKSSRTNYVPIELQPPGDKRQTRAAIHQSSPVTKSRYGGAFISSPVTCSASNKTLSHAKRPQSAGKATSSSTSRSPSKPSQPPTSQSQSIADTPAPPKRSHKKKVRSLSPQLYQPSQTTNPHKTRRAGRASDVTGGQINGSDVDINGWRGNGELSWESAMEEPSGTAPTSRPQRLSLKVRMPTVHIQNTAHVLPERRYGSFQEWFEKEGRMGLVVEDPDPHLTEKEAIREARLRTRIAEAAKPGGLLSKDRCQFYRPEPYEPPPRQYTHQDRLATHAVYFKKLMEQEHGKHRRNAKEYAEKAAAVVRRKEEESYREWKQAQPKTEADIAQEQLEAAKEVWEQVREDIKQKWMMVTQLVEARRLQRWQDEQDRLGKKALNEAIEKSKGLLDRRRRGGSDVGSDEESDDEGASGIEKPGSKSDAESDDEDNMSSSQSDSDEDQVLANEDEGLTQDELRQKYANVHSLTDNNVGKPENLDQDPMDMDRGGVLSAPDQTEQNLSDSPIHPPRHLREQTASPVPLEEVDDALMDYSDASTEMDSEMDDDDDEATSDDEGDDQEDEAGDEGSEEEESNTGLLGFFSKKAKQAFQVQEKEAEKETKAPIEAQDDEYEDEAEEVSLIPDIAQAPTPSATPATASEEPHPKDFGDSALHTTVDATSQPNLKPVANETANDLTIEKLQSRQTSPLMNLKSLVQDPSLPSTPVSNNPLKTPIPSLLRGTLREYQHFGLDWLAGLYAAGTNGILADEMGLGKTIQTIALLAHLAVEHEQWGPHLIIVPTSVMLNWEIEFKKFLPGFKVLTYYGTQEERKKKRQGWMDDDKWNVWITSYTLVTNDHQIFKRKAWHYMILDEAHNIKNFQSLRWQTLLTFNTHSRLLLTGTPLQNNLTELWSLLFFLMPSDSTETGIGGFADLQEFTDWFKKPVEQILEHGRDVMDDDARAIVAKLHKVLRPYLLRRLKADVEKQMPGKYEHVVYCRLSKRQRYLYDGFMSRAQTRETLASGNTFSIMNALMQLRKVCNHPDLFETRQIVTSFAMPKSAVADFEIKELLVRRRLLQSDSMNTVDLNVINLLPGENESFSALDTIQRQRLGALGALRQLSSQQWGRVKLDLPFDGSSVKGALTSYENMARRLRYDQLRHAAYYTSLRSQRRPLYSYSLMEKLRFGIKTLPHQPKPGRKAQLSEWYSNHLPALDDMVLTLPKRSNALETTISKFACVTPAVVATDMVPLTLCHKGIETIQAAKELCPSKDPYHKARMRLSIAFPDKRLLQYDCGKLQKLDGLLRTLQAGGHRALIFTQMTRVLDILEQFLNIHGHRYLRLDGATKIEQRQVLTDRFNNDNRILAFILSSRSGGIGINLTGADTVIFYDLDWNPAMDKQCQDRCHRIGQTRDVHIYRLVSEYTIEANILRKANQKRMLDDVVIQEGEFTTDYFNNMNVKDMIGDEAFDDANAEANAAMDRVLGGRGTGKVFEAVEDQEDIAAAKLAEKELAQNQDAADFDEKGSALSTTATTPKTPGPPTPGELMPQAKKAQGGIETTMTMEAAESGLVSTLPQDAEDIEELPSCDDFMIRFLDWELKDIPVQPPVDKTKKKVKKGKEHSLRKR